ncbi:MAG: hypothetical protein ACRD3N_14615 [Terracidiphilus sp.]
MKAVHLHIGRVVIEGLPEARQRQFARALEERLQEWAASGAANVFNGGARVRIPALDAGQLKPGATAAQAARQVVDSIARRVSAHRQSGSPASTNASRGEAHRHV